MRPDYATLIQGLSVLALGTVLLLDQAGQVTLDFGTVLLLDQAGQVTLDFGSLAPIVLTVLGLVLLVGGLAKRDGA